MSSAELTATEEAEMAECEGDKVVTMMDVLQEQEDFEEDANAVLGASDEKNCTYIKGYIKRQALYACLTCCPDAKTDPTKRAGVCLACSLSCHENHELVELYTKRNFCCDCGNSKFSSHPCQFTPNKPDLNENNSYNQNFSGLYCICHRPYPDPEASFEDEMIQCVVCEDWLHASHLEAKVPPNEQYTEMICKSCMENNEFLYDYSDLAVNVESEEVDVTTVSTNKVNRVCNGDSETHELKANNKENGDIDMTENHKTVSEEEKDDKKEEVSNETSKDTNESGVITEVESKEKVEDAPMEVEEKQNSEVPEDPKNKNDSNAIASDVEKEIGDSKENAADDAITPDSNVESNTNGTCKDPGSEKPEEQLAENGDKECNSEQNSSITNDEVDNEKNDNKDSDEKSEVVTTEEEKVEPNSVINETAEETDGKVSETKDEENVEEPEKVEQTENKNDESLEKDDLMESIDRIINGDDDESSEQSKDKVESTNVSDQEKPLLEKKFEETTKLEENSAAAENNEKIEINQKEEERSVDNQSQSDVDMEASIPKNDDSTKTNGDAVMEQSKENKRKLDEDSFDKADVKKPKLDANACLRPKGVKRRFKGATFWPGNFREKLCTCSECITMYKDMSVLFLIDLEDTVSAYETLGKEKNDGRSSQYEIGMQALSSLGRIQQINALTEYNKMRDKLLDFLKSFKDRKEIVKEEDIKAFFAGMKPKREPDGVYFCR